VHAGLQRGHGRGASLWKPSIRVVWSHWPRQRLAVHERLHPAGGLRLRRSFSRSLGYSRLK
jgi:hypothetical protein